MPPVPAGESLADAAVLPRDAAAPAARAEKAAQPAVSYADLQRSLTEALEQQTATSEILKVISARRPTSSRSSTRSSRAAAVRGVRRLRSSAVDGEVLRLVAHHGPIPTGAAGEFTMPDDPGHGRTAGRARARTIHVADIQAETRSSFQRAARVRAISGIARCSSVPLMREGVAIGALSVRRAEVRPFTDQQIGASADLRRPGGHRDRERAAVQRDEGGAGAADGDGRDPPRDLRSPTDVQPVFDAIVQSAAQAVRGTIRHGIAFGW